MSGRKSGQAILKRIEDNNKSAGVKSGESILKKFNYTINDNDGNRLGNVGYEAYRAIKENRLDRYLPANDEEKRVIESISPQTSSAYEQRTAERDEKMAQNAASTQKVKDTNAHKNYTSATRNLAVARRSAGVVSPKKVKQLEKEQRSARKAYDNANKELEKLQVEKAQLEAEQRMDDVGQKYNIDVNDFSYSDLEKWAEQHNHTVDINLQGSSTMKATKNATDEEKEAFKILKTLAEERAAREVAKELPVISSVGTVAMAPARGIQGAISTIEDSGRVAKGETIDLFSPNKSLARSTRTIRGTVDKEYASKWFGGAEIPLVGNVGSALYNSTMSIGDNVVNMAVGAVVGKAAAAAGASSAATNRIVSGLTSTLMASDATVNSIIANKERGLSDSKALGLGIASGLIELATEKFSIDKIIENPKDTLKKVILKGMAAEGTEEMSSEVLNKVLDGMVNQDNSQMSIEIKEYIKQGYSREKAAAMALGNAISDVLGAGITGAFSGAAMGGTFSSINKLAETKQRQQNIDKVNSVAEKFNAEADEKIELLSKDATDEEISAHMMQVVAKAAELDIDLQSTARSDGFGEHGRKAFEASIKKGQDEALYTMGFQRMYNLGQTNTPLEKADSVIKGNRYIQALSSDQRMAAYYAGQNDAKARLEAEKNAVKFVKYYTDDAGVVDNEAAKKADEADLREIDRIAKITGSQVVIVDDIEGANGYVELGKIHISLNAQHKALIVMAHEVTHRMQELAPESYRKYRDFVIDTVGVEMIESYRTELNKKDVYLTESGIMDEIAADYTRNILSDTNKMQQFIDDALNGKLDKAASVSESRNVLQKLYDAIRDFLKKIGEKFGKNKAMQNKAAEDTFGTDIDALKQAEVLLGKALKDSAKTVEQLKKTSSASKADSSLEGGAGTRKRFSVKLDGKEEVVFERSFAEQVSEVLSKDTDITDGNHVFVCETPSILKQLGFPDLPMLISKGHLRDMNHQEVEGISKYHGLSEPEINKIPYILENPAMVFKTVSEKNPDAICILSNILDGKGRPMLISIKTNGKGKYNEVRLESNFILSAYGRNNAQGYLEQIASKSENVMYISKKRTQEMLKGARLQLPARLSNLRSDIIIHKIDNNVNTQYMQKSENNSQRKNSIKMDDVLRQNETLKKVVVKLNSDIQKMKGQKGNYNPKRIATVSKDIIDEFDFAYERAKLSEKLDGLSEAAKQMIDGKMDIDILKAKFVDVAKDVIETGTINDSAEYAESKALRDTLRTTAISLNEDARRNLGDEYETIRKSTFGRLRLVKEGGVPIDIQYRELAELYPEFFDAETEIHQSDQLKRIAEVLDGLQSLKSNPYDGYIDEASEWLSNIMMDRIFNEIFVAGETGKVKVTVDMRNMRDEMADNLQQIMARDREWREREYSKLESRYERRVKNYTEARQKAIKIKQIKLHTERLSKALLNPSERFAVPEDLKKPVAELLSCIDLRNDRIGEKARETLGDLMNTYNTIAEQEYELGMVLDPQLVHNLDAISEAVKGLDVKEKRVSDLGVVTLEQLRNSIMAMETMLRNYNQTFRDGKKQQIDMLAASACSEIKERVKAIKKTSKVKLVKGFSDMLNFDMLNPWDYFHQMGGTFESLFAGLREGENRQIKNLAKGKEYLDEITKKYGISQKDMKDKSVKTFTFANGEKVELTKSQIMSFYLLWRQEHTHEHITEGGIRPATVTQSLIENKDGTAKVKMTVSEDYSAARANLDDVAAILSTLSENEKKFAESISNFFVKECAEWGNEVALKLYGYKKFNTLNYFPIVSDKMYLQEDFGVSADSTIKNMGITKKRIKHANNPIIIEDIFEVYARHVSDMAKYNAYVLPLQDIQRVFNSRGLDGENNVKALVATKFGKQAVTYFSKLMVDINMGINNQYGNALSSNLISTYKQAKMGLNARVVIQQPISYIRAAALIDPKYMTQAAGKKVDIEKVFKYSPIARWKSWGFFSTDTGKDMYSLMTNKKEISDYTMWFAGKADEWTWKRIWAAVELETADLYPDLQKGSEAFYEACGKRFDEIVDRTQVVDSTLHRSQALRSPDGFTKMAYSFMSEPLKTYNLLRTAAVDALTAKDPQSKKKLARTVGVCVLSSAVLAAVTGAFDTLTGDDEEEFLKNWGSNLLGDAVGMIPYIKDVSSIIQGFTVERMDMQGIGDVANAILMLGNENYTWPYKIINLCAKGAELGGVPVGSIKKFAYDLIAKNIFKGVDNHLFFYNVAKLIHPVDSKKKGEFYNILFNTYKAGNKKQYDKILRDMIDSGIKADDIESELRKKFKNSGIKETFPVPWNKSFDISENEEPKKFGVKDLSGTQYQSYGKKVTAMEKDIVTDLNRMRKGLTEDEYQKHLKSAHEYVVETALEQLSNGKYESDKPWVNKAQKAEELYGLDPAEVIMLYRYKNDLKPPVGKDKFENGEKKNLLIDYLNGMELTPAEWKYLYEEICGYKK